MSPIYTSIVISASSFELDPGILLKRYIELMADDNGWWKPPRTFGPEECELRLRVLKVSRWPPFIGKLATGLLVAEDVLQPFLKHAGSDIQVIPIRVDAPKAARKPPNYMFVNCLHEEDVLNCGQSRARISEGASLPLDRLEHEGDLTIDSSRMHSPRELFVVKYLSEVVLGPKLSAALGEVRTRDFWLDPIRDVPEQESERQAILRRLESELKAGSAKSEVEAAVKTPAALEKLLKVKLPAAAKKYFADVPEFEDCATELFDLSRAAEETQQLRQWKELKWPTELVCISDDGRGGYWALDTRHTKAGDCPVVYFDHELADVDAKTGAITPNLEVAAPTLRAWLKGLKAGGDGLPKLKVSAGKAASKPRRANTKKKAKKR